MTYLLAKFYVLILCLIYIYMELFDKNLKLWKVTRQLYVQTQGLE